MISTRIQLEKEANQIAEKWVQANRIREIFRCRCNQASYNVLVSAIAKHECYSFADTVGEFKTNWSLVTEVRFQ